jgi:hypothetical protein
MSKLNQLQREQLKRIVLDSILQRLTAAETQAYVKDKLGVEIGIDHLRHVKMELRQDSKKELGHLRKDRFSYMNHLFFERAEELKAMQRKLWEIIKDNQEDNPDIAIRSINELHKLSNSLSSMYEMLPVLGRLPSDSFAGFGVDINNDDTTGAADKQEGESGEIPPSTLGSGGVYHIDKFNKQI